MNKKDTDERFEQLCVEFATKALAFEPKFSRSPELVAYMSEIVRTTFAFHMWRLLDEVEKEFKDKRR